MSETKDELYNRYTAYPTPNYIDMTTVEGPGVHLQDSFTMTTGRGIATALNAAFMAGMMEAKKEQKEKKTAKQDTLAGDVWAIEKATQQALAISLVAKGQSDAKILDIVGYKRMYELLVKLSYHPSALSENEKIILGILNKEEQGNG